MSAAEIFEGLADAAEASAAAYRRRAAMLRRDAPPPRAGGSVVETVRRMFAVLGHRQVQVLEALERAGAAGMTSAEVASAISYGEPNTYNTLKGLARQKLVVKDISVHPYRYRLAPGLLDGREDGETGDQ